MGGQVEGERVGLGKDPGWCGEGAPVGPHRPVGLKRISPVTELMMNPTRVPAVKDWIMTPQ
ncbi:hypothetical protein GCM10010099_22870 [Streptomyces cinereus]|nr:hypothetical protein GCM10010099_22870 [Streptomyces cinereus]